MIFNENDIHYMVNPRIFSCIVQTKASLLMATLFIYFFSGDSRSDKIIRFVDIRI